MFRLRNPLKKVLSLNKFFYPLQQRLKPGSSVSNRFSGTSKQPIGNPSSQTNSEKEQAYTRPKSGKYFWLALTAGSAAALTTLNEERRQLLKTQLSNFHHALTARQPAPPILDIPGLPQNLGIIHGVSTRTLGNFGFVTLNDGVKPAELSADISKGIDEIANFTSQKLGTSAQGKKTLLILNETAYANAKAPGLLRDQEGKPQFILTLTEDNIKQFIEQHRFSEEGDFASLRDKCVRVTADGFVSNIGEFADYQLYFAVNTADAAPVVLFDDKAGVVGIMTCSWHNVAKAEFDELIKKMQQLGASPSQIKMGIGPGLGANSLEFNTCDTRNFYEPGVIDKRDGSSFQGNPSLKKHIRPKAKDWQKSYINIPGMLVEIAMAHGIQPKHFCFDSSWDSMKNTNFFSARRSTPANERETEAQKKYPKTARGITFVHRLFRSQTPSPSQKTAENKAVNLKSPSPLKKEA